MALGFLSRGLRADWPSAERGLDATGRVTGTAAQAGAIAGAATLTGLSLATGGGMLAAMPRSSGY